ncbi:MAG: DUF3106 domain-containing protein [Acidobacteriota bacterium]|nr:DUF3106 domain-containing protein [Acidobacteriota bacterium]
MSGLRLAADQPNAKGGGRAAAAPKAPRQQAARRENLKGQPAAQQLERLLRMTPEQRDRALASLPPARRANIQRRLDDLERATPAARGRMLTRLEMLNSLPPDRQREVRQSLRQFQQMPAERHSTIQREMRSLAPLTEEERQERMNSEGFQNRYNPEEREMIRNMLEVVP